MTTLRVQLANAGPPCGRQRTAHSSFGGLRKSGAMPAESNRQIVFPTAEWPGGPFLDSVG